MKPFTRITLELPTELITATEQAIKTGKAKSIDEFVALVLQHELLKIRQIEMPDEPDKSERECLEDPIWKWGKNPCSAGIKDASENLDRYLYDSV